MKDPNGAIEKRHLGYRRKRHQENIAHQHVLEFLTSRSRLGEDQNGSGGGHRVDNSDKDLLGNLLPAHPRDREGPRPDKDKSQ